MSNPATKTDDLSAALARIAALEAENTALAAKAKTQGNGRLSCKVSQAGACSVYGIGRFPVTLYASQWARLIEFIPTVSEFLQAHASEFKTKPVK